MTSIDDSIGVIGSSIGKSAIQGSRKRNEAALNNKSKRGPAQVSSVNLKGSSSTNPINNKDVIGKAPLG